MKDLRAKFRAADANGNREVTYDEVVALITKLKADEAAEEAKDIVEK